MSKMTQVFILKEKLKAKPEFKNPLSLAKTSFSFVPGVSPDS